MAFTPLVIDDGSSLLVETDSGFEELLVEERELFGNAGIQVTIDGVDLGEFVQRDWKVVRKVGVRSDMTLMIDAGINEIDRLPVDGSIIEAREQSSPLIFGGIIDQPNNALLPGSKR